jgi:hypothetical protein
MSQSLGADSQQLSIRCASGKRCLSVFSTITFLEYNQGYSATPYAHVVILAH